MNRSNGALSLDLKDVSTQELLLWDWDIEHADRRREAKADAALNGAPPFQVDRKLLKDIVLEKMCAEVGRITFLSSGTFHKAYLITLVDGAELVARVARRFMPRLKTESEVATMQYLREKTNVPVPIIYHYDSNPYNRLGGEWILMSKAPGIPLSRVYHSLAFPEVAKLFANLAAIVIPLFGHRFAELGSLYLGPCPNSSSNVATPKATQHLYSAYPFSPTLHMASLTSALSTPKATAKAPSRFLAPSPAHAFHVGPIISWAFFGSNRGDLVHPHEMNRGPWTTSHSYFESCAEREINGVIRENEGKAAPHRLHLDPDEIRSSRHHHLRAVPGDESDESDEWNLEESEDEWEGPGDAMYRDYRRMQRSTFLVAHLKTREETVRKEMERWMRMMEKLSARVRPFALAKGRGVESFALDCHDLSLENVFVDATDHTKITCIIDWESTTTRPLWACAHVPAFLQTSLFTAKLFREAVAKLAVSIPSSPEGVSTPSTPSAPTPKHHGSRDHPHPSISEAAMEWLHYEAVGTRMRMAHRFVEWDGWEEGLIDTILGPEEDEEDWYALTPTSTDVPAILSPNGNEMFSPPLPESRDTDEGGGGGGGILTSAAPLTRRTKPTQKLPFIRENLEREQMLNSDGDVCGGRGGELGRRLEAWLSVSGSEGDDSDLDSRWRGEDMYEADTF